MGLDEEALKAAAGEACAAHEGLDGDGALRDAGGVFEQGSVARHKGGGEEAEDLPEGEVPGHDGEEDAEGFPADIAVGVAGGDGLGGDHAGGVVGEEAAGIGAFEDLVAGGVERLAHLVGDGEGEVVDIVFEQGGELAHTEGAVLDGHGGVGGEGVGGEGDLLAYGFVGEGFEGAEELAGCGIDGLDRHEWGRSLLRSGWCDARLARRGVRRTERLARVP